MSGVHVVIISSTPPYGIAPSCARSSSTGSTWPRVENVQAQLPCASSWCIPNIPLSIHMLCLMRLCPHYSLVLTSLKAAVDPGSAWDMFANRVLYLATNPLICYQIKIESSAYAKSDTDYSSSTDMHIVHIELILALPVGVSLRDGRSRSKARVCKVVRDPLIRKALRD